MRVADELRRHICVMVYDGLNVPWRVICQALGRDVFLVCWPQLIAYQSGAPYWVIEVFGILMYVTLLTISRESRTVGKLLYANVMIIVLTLTGLRFPFWLDAWASTFVGVVGAFSLSFLVKLFVFEVVAHYWRFAYPCWQEKFWYYRVVVSTIWCFGLLMLSRDDFLLAFCLTVQYFLVRYLWIRQRVGVRSAQLDQFDLYFAQRLQPDMMMRTYNIDFCRGHLPANWPRFERVSERLLKERVLRLWGHFIRCLGGEMTDELWFDAALSVVGFGPEITNSARLALLDSPLDPEANFSAVPDLSDDGSDVESVHDQEPDAEVIHFDFDPTEPHNQPPNLVRSRAVPYERTVDFVMNEFSESEFLSWLNFGGAVFAQEVTQEDVFDDTSDSFLTSVSSLFEETVDPFRFLENDMFEQLWPESIENGDVWSFEMFDRIDRAGLYEPQSGAGRVISNLVGENQELVSVEELALATEKVALLVGDFLSIASKTDMLKFVMRAYHEMFDSSFILDVKSIVESQWDLLMSVLSAGEEVYLPQSGGVDFWPLFRSLVGEKKHRAVTMFHEMFGTIFLYPFLKEKLDLYLPFAFTKSLAELGKSQGTDLVTYFMTFLRELGDFIKNVVVYLATGDLECLSYKAKGPYGKLVEFQTEFVELKNKVYDQPVREQGEIEGFLRKVCELDVVFRGLSSDKDPLAGAVVKLQADIREWCDLRLKAILASAPRVASFGLGIFGVPGCGKTSIALDALQKYFMHWSGVEYTKNAWYAVKPNDSYQESMDRHVFGLVYDDIDAFEHAQGDNKHLSMFWDGTGGAQVHPNKAFADKDMFADPKVVILLSNFIHFGFDKDVRCFLAVFRRFLRYEMVYCGHPMFDRSQAGGTGIDVLSIPQAELLSSFKFRKVLIAQTTDTALFSTSNGPWLTFGAFLKEIEVCYKDHRAKGEARLSSSLNSEFCACGLLKSLHGENCQSYQQQSSVGELRVSVADVLFFMLMLVVWRLVPIVGDALAILAIGLIYWLRGWLMRFKIQSLPITLLRLYMVHNALASRPKDEGFSFSRLKSLTGNMFRHTRDELKTYARYDQLLSNRTLKALGVVAFFTGLGIILSRERKDRFEPQSDPRAVIPPVLGRDQIKAGPAFGQALSDFLERLRKARGVESKLKLHVDADPLPESALRKRVSDHLHSMFVFDGREYHSYAMILHGGLMVTTGHTFSQLEGDEFVVHFPRDPVHGFACNLRHRLSRKEIHFMPHLDLAFFMWPGPTKQSLKTNLLSSSELPKKAKGVFINTERTVVEGEYELKLVPTTTKEGVVKHVYCWHGPTESIIGECGLPLFLYVNGGCFVGGILIAGKIVESGRSPVGGFAVLTKEVLEEAWDALLEKGCPARMPLAEGEPMVLQSMEGLDVGPLDVKHSIFEKFPKDLVVPGEVVGTWTKNYNSSIKEVMKVTPFEGAELDACRVAYVPASADVVELVYPDGKTGKYSYLNAYFSSCAEPKGEWDPVVMDMAIRALESDWSRIFAGAEFHYPCIDSAMRGILGTSLNKIPLSTSSGNILYKGNKEPFVFEDPAPGDPDFQRLSVNALEAMGTVLYSLMCGFCVPFVFIIIPKMNEVLKAAKFALKRARVVNCVHFTLNVLMRFYLGAALDVCYRTGRIWGCAVGMNPLGPEWGVAAREFEELDGGWVMDPDIKGMEFRMKADDSWRIGYAPFFRALTKAGYESGRLLVASSLAASSLWHYISVKGDVTAKIADLASGKWDTWWLNSVTCKFFVFYVYYFLHPKRHLGFESVPHPREVMRYRFYGDDSLVGVSDSIKSWFSPEEYYRVLSECNVETTYGVDKNEKPRWKKLHEATFLKRSFVRRDGVVWAPLDFNSILKMLSWYEPSAKVSPAHQFSDILDSAHRELFIHGREVFDLWLPRLRDWQSRFGDPQRDKLKTFEVLLSEYGRGEFKAW